VGRAAAPPTAACVGLSAPSLIYSPLRAEYISGSATIPLAKNALSSKYFSVSRLLLSRQFCRAKQIAQRVGAFLKNSISDDNDIFEFFFIRERVIDARKSLSEARIYTRMIQKLLSAQYQLRSLYFAALGTGAKFFGDTIYRYALIKKHKISRQHQYHNGNTHKNANQNS